MSRLTHENSATDDFNPEIIERRMKVMRENLVDELAGREKARKSFKINVGLTAAALAVTATLAYQANNAFKAEPNEVDMLPIRSTAATRCNAMAAEIRVDPTPEARAICDHSEERRYIEEWKSEKNKDGIICAIAGIFSLVGAVSGAALTQLYNKEIKKHDRALDSSLKSLKEMTIQKNMISPSIL